MSYRLFSPDWAVAASLIAAAVTVVLAWFAFLSARAAGRTARAAEAQLEAQVRPLLIDVTPREGPREATEFLDGHTLSSECTVGRVLVSLVDSTAYLSIPLRNVGTGLAEVRGVELLSGPGGFAGSTPKPNVPPGEEVRFNFVLPREEWLEDHSELFAIVDETFLSADYRQGAGPAPGVTLWDSEGIVAFAVSYTDLAGTQPTKTRVEIRRDRASGEWSIHRVQLFSGMDALPLFEVDPMNLRC